MRDLRILARILVFTGILSSVGLMLQPPTASTDPLQAQARSLGYRRDYDRSPGSGGHYIGAHEIDWPPAP